jgi:hypothetical protein
MQQNIIKQSSIIKQIINQAKLINNLELQKEKLDQELNGKVFDLVLTILITQQERNNDKL